MPVLVSYGLNICFCSLNDMLDVCNKEFVLDRKILWFVNSNQNTSSILSLKLLLIAMKCSFVLKIYIFAHSICNHKMHFQFTIWYKLNEMIHLWMYDLWCNNWLLSFIQVIEHFLVLRVQLAFWHIRSNKPLQYNEEMDFY